MKKLILALVAVVAMMGVAVYAADTLITGYNAETGIGTFKVVSDGTDSTLTVDKLVVSDAITAPGGVTGRSSVTTNIAATAYVTNIVVQYAVYADTNGAVAVTNIVLQKATPTAQNASLWFVSGIATNKP
jgi:hypothetical protein